MNLNDCIAEITSLAEHCEDEESKDILLSILKNYQICNFVNLNNLTKNKTKNFQ